MMNIDTPYYEDHERVSNSSIGWFLKGGPSYFYKMLKGEIEGDKGPQLERGTMIHSFILTPEEFQKDYVVWNKSRPFSVQQEKFCQALASSLEIEPNRAILDAYKQAYSTAGKSEDKMLSEGLKIASTLKDYIDFLKSDDKRLMITPSEAKMLERVKQNIEHHKIANTIVYPSDYFKTFDTNISPKFENKNLVIVDAISAHFHEFHINWEYPVIYDIDVGQHETEHGTYTIKCKSLLDGLTLDFKNKKATIYDLKTTAKLWHFEESIEMYDYLRQLCYYKMAVMWYLKNECGEENPGQWVINFYIIGIDTTGSCEIRVFNINRLAVEKRREVINTTLFNIAWHQMNNKWEHSREYYEGDGSESLNL